MQKHTLHTKDRIIFYDTTCDVDESGTFWFNFIHYDENTIDLIVRIDETPISICVGRASLPAKRHVEAAIHDLLVLANLPKNKHVAEKLRIVAAAIDEKTEDRRTEQKS